MGVVVLGPITTQDLDDVVAYYGSDVLIRGNCRHSPFGAWHYFHTYGGRTSNEVVGAFLLV